MMSTILPIDSKELHPYAESLNRLEATDWALDPPWLSHLRRAGSAHFSECGMPSIRQEEWRFTNLKPIDAHSFDFCLGELDLAAVESELAGCSFDELDSYRVVLVNGQFCSRFSKLEGLPQGFVIESLKDAIKNRPEEVSKRLATQVKVDHSSLAALNTAFFQDGLFIYAPKNFALDRPIQVLQFVTSSGSSTGNPVGASPRMLAIAESGAEFALVERFVGAKDSIYWTNSVAEFFLAPNASIEHLKLQEDSANAFHTAAIQSHLDQDARFTSHSVALGASISRNDIQSVMDGRGSEAVLNGLYLGQKDQLVDHHTLMDHRQPNCNSHEYYHGILTDQSRGVFSGKIYVHQIAQKTDAIQNSRNLVLSDSATINAKPQLEIYADDVRCTHGATIGQLDEDSIFYLRARGINEALARRMLIHAFASDVVDRIPFDPVKDYLEGILADRFDPKSC